VIDLESSLASTRRALVIDFMLRRVRNRQRYYYYYYNVWKLHRPRMPHGLLADNVDTTLASLLYSCTTDVLCVV